MFSALNRARLWRRPVRVWGMTLIPPTLDRWLYLRLHRLGLMGRRERRFIENSVRAGMRVADIGANIGLYTLLMARLAGAAGRVHAFEPQAAMAGALRQNVELNRAAQVVVYPYAVGAAAGSGVLDADSLNSGDARLAPAGRHLPASNRSAAKPTVSIHALDEILEGEMLDFIKMDIQGWEGRALQGMSALLRRSPGLTLYFEFWPKGLRAAGSSERELKQILVEQGLRVFRAGGDAREIDLEAEARLLRPDGFVNLVARR